MREFSVRRIKAYSHKVMPRLALQQRVQLQKQSVYHQLHTKRSIQFKKLIKKAQIKVIPPLPQQSMSIKQFIDNSFLATIAKPISEAALITFISIVYSSLDVAPSSLSVVPLEAHIFILNNLEREDDKLLARFQRLFKQIIRHFYVWIRPQAIRRASCIKQFILETDFFNKMSAHIKLVPI